MRRRWLSGVCVGVVALWPSTASACDLYLAYGPMGMHTTTVALGAAVHVIPYGDSNTSFVPTVDIGFRLGEGVVIHPAAGYCWWGQVGGLNPGDDTGKLLAGGGLALNLLTNDTWSLGVQSHVTWEDHGELSTTTIPVMAAAAFHVGETASLHVGAGVKVLRFAFDMGRQTHLTKNYDPAVSAGISLPLGSLRLSGGMLVVRSGEGDVQVGGGDDGYQTDFSFGGGIQFPLGG